MQGSRGPFPKSGMFTTANINNDEFSVQGFNRFMDFSVAGFNAFNDGGDSVVARSAPEAVYA